MAKTIKVALSLACCFVLVANSRFVYAVEKDVHKSGTAKSVDEAKKQILKAIDDIKLLIQTRAPRPGGTCASNSAVLPNVDNTLLEQIRSIVCQLKSCICEVDHEGVWISLIDEIACSQIDNPVVPVNFADAVAAIAQALTEILNRLGCPECENELLPPDVLGDLCYISSQIDVLDSKVDTIESNISSCCTVIGSPNETIDCDFITTVTECPTINNSELSIIQWLKAIYLKCQNLNEG